MGSRLTGDDRRRRLATKRRFATTLLAVLLVVLPTTRSAVVVAQGECLAESEPNDIPDGGVAFAGVGCVAGALPEGDAQDLYLWSVTDDDARHRWTIALSGIAGVVTAARLLTVTSAPGATPITLGSSILEVDTSPDATAASSMADVFIPPGTYALGVGRTAILGPAPASFDYRISVASGAPSPSSSDTEPNDDAGTATALGGAFALSGEAAGSRDIYAWTIDAAGATHGWDVEMQGTLGVPGSLSLTMPDGRILSSDVLDTTARAHLYDLHLAAGTYLLGVDGSGSGPLPYILTSTITDTQGFDAEPNDDPADALPLEAGVLATGRLAHAVDRDQYRFSVGAALASVLVDVRLITPTGPPRQVCLSRIDPVHPVEQLQCSLAAAGWASLSGLLLPAGDYLLTVSGDVSPDDPYFLRIDPTSAPVADFETEPNDTAATATPLDPTTTMRARTRAGDGDYFRVHTTGEPQLWQVDVTGVDPSVSLTKADGTAQRTARSIDGTTVRLEDQYLIPGDHWFLTTGDRGDVTVRLTPMGPPDPDAEREPNDDASTAEALPIGVRRIGRLPSAYDTDVYRFSLAATEHVHLHLDAPSDGKVELALETGGSRIVDIRDRGVGQAIDYDALLWPGDYLLRLSTRSPGQGRYALRISREDPLTLADDQEPNDAAWQARTMPPSLSVEGTATAGDADWYALPELLDNHPVTIETTGAVGALGISDGTTTTPMVADADGTTFHSGPLPAGAPIYLVVQPTGDYGVRVTDGETPVAPTATLPVTLALTVPEAIPAAYWSAGQRITGDLRLTNSGTGLVHLDLDAATSQVNWSVAFARTAIDLAAGETMDVPLTITMQPDLWADIAVRLTVRARNGDGAQQTTFVEITPGRDALPIDPRQAWSVPDALLGGLDVASLALGAVPVPSIDATAEASLHDGVSPGGGGMQLFGWLPPVTLTVDLAGDRPVPIVGTILDPLAGDGSVQGAVRQFHLLLSTDGVTYQEALSGDLTTLPVDQAFVLPSPVMARFAQLRIDTVYGDPGRLLLGEWKVVASPGAVPVDEPLNIADPARGGHVVWTEPLVRDNAAGAFLDEDRTRQLAYLDPGNRQAWVVGFLDDRAASVTELQWVDPAGSDPAARMRRVELAISLGGPVGPWQDVGPWDLARTADGSPTPFVFDAPTWARFIRFTGDTIPKDQSQIELPAVLRVMEAPMDASYRSILGEWGQGGQPGPYELANPPDLTVPADDRTHDTPATAAPLTPDKLVSGRVHAGVGVDWFVFTAPEGQNSATFTVRGFPIVGVSVTVFDPSGASVPTTFGPGADPGTVAYEVGVTPGVEYRVEVQQPPFSAVLTYDTSVSISPYQAFLDQAMDTYSGAVVPGQESLQIVPFDEPPLLEDWSDDPYLLQGAIDDWIARASSSWAETGLVDSMRLLQDREGARAILIVTDAEGPQRDELWQELETVRPQVFSVLIGGAMTPLVDRALMQDWAAAGGGFYQYAQSHSDMDRAFDRMATWLRRPAAYTLSFETSTVKLPPPAPGSLSVVTPTGADGSPTPSTVGKDVAIELLLDTSGSMLETFGGQSRIAIAQAVLTKLVTADLPAGTPVALRVFSQRPRSCATELAVPLGPLDPAAMAATIQGISILRSVNTPLAAAIARIGDDLADVTGTRIVVVVSDGLENCGGNPAKAVKKLRAQGLAVTVNVVGLGLDKKTRKAIGQLARLGGGTYFDARDPASLETAIRTAVSAPFAVYDASGAQVGGGTVNGATVSLPPGTYRVVVLSDPPVTLTAVVESGGSVTLTLPASASP